MGAELVKHGFAIDSKLVKATKKVAKRNRITIFFDCYDFTPEKIEFRLLLKFFIHELEEEMRDFFEFCGESFNGSSIVLGEGDFIPSMKDLSPKLRSAYTHTVIDFSKVDIPLQECRTNLNNYIIPRLNIFSDLKVFQEFVSRDYEEVVRLKIVPHALVAMKLAGNPELKGFTIFLWQKLELDDKPDFHIMRKFVQNILSFPRL